MPEPRRIVLLRHGQTPWNAEQRWQGQADVPLDESGRLQAKSVAGVLAEYRPTFVVGSDLARGSETTRIVAEAAGVTAAYDPRLREVDVGRLSGTTKAEAAETHGPGPYDYARYGGESDEQVRARVSPAVVEAMERLGAGETGVLVGHGASLRLALCDVLGWPEGTSLTLGALANCGWMELAEDGVGFHGGEGWRLTAYNRVPPIS